ncbi:hypothetical protein [Pseudomonas aeruginosa]|uniref:hypothetical protein n=1 Tax=Pseudomonas aeruginosa TaxID=287 RepID=UPI00223898A0|nr:hypothetical protein [Pseudomonas aeruginosa]
MLEDRDDLGLGETGLLHGTSWLGKTCQKVLLMGCLRIGEAYGITALRDELLKLHAMALTIVEGTAPAAPTENACIWAEAESVQLGLEALATWIRSAQGFLTPLTSLEPEHQQ